jgi:nitric oxide reductase NorQ protein
MTNFMKAVVTQEGRFLVARLADGIDVSNQIDRDIRRRAVELGVECIYTDGEWSVPGYSKPAGGFSFAKATMPEPEIIEIVEPDAGHKAVTEFIHKSVGLKPQALIMNDLKWKYLVRSAMRGRNIMMTGPAGTGKTIAAKELVKALERPDFYFNLGATQDPRATLIGNTHFSKEDGTYFAESLFVKAIQTPNAVILLDELSRAHPEAWNILMTVLDLNQRYLRLDEKDGAPTIKVAEGVSFIATANIGNEYTSTRIMDRALQDRFITIEMDQLDEVTEFELLKMKYPLAHQPSLQAVAEIASTTRKDMKSASPKLSSCLSTRACVEIASLIFDGFTLTEAAEVAIYPFFSEDGGVDSERTYVKQIVQKYCVNPETEGEDLFGADDVAKDMPF